MSLTVAASCFTTSADGLDALTVPEVCACRTFNVNPTPPGCTDYCGLQGAYKIADRDKGLEAKLWIYPLHLLQCDEGNASACVCIHVCIYIHMYMVFYTHACVRGCVCTRRLGAVRTRAYTLPGEERTTQQRLLRGHRLEL